VQPALDVAILRSIGAPGGSRRLDLPGFDELERAARAEGLDTTDATRSAIARQIRQLRRASGTFEAVLRRTRPELGFVVDYGIASMAFNLACARVGIPSIEIQHGVQGPFHWAYARWSALPPGGYELLPTSFWVWSSEEAAVIEEWSAPVLPRHRAVPGGNLWLDAWRELTSEAVRAVDERVRAAKQRAPGERHVLVPMQTRHGDRTSLGPFLAAIAARPTWRWWIRAHPGMSTEEAARAKRILGEVPGARLELEASELPLYAVLRHVDAVATMASSVVIEASEMGVPSVITDADVAGHYESAIAAGWARVADPSLSEALEIQIARAPDLPAYERPRLPPDEALDELLSRSAAPTG
jgi:hypothetical protein